jgi:hypothetical protein
MSNQRHCSWVVRRQLDHPLDVKSPGMGCCGFPSAIPTVFGRRVSLMTTPFSSSSSSILEKLMSTIPTAAVWFSSGLPSAIRRSAKGV